MSDNNNSSSSSSSSTSNSRSLSVPVANIKNSNISDIQWAMIDKKRYFPLTVMNMFAVRTLLYPLTLIRTRLQVQARDSLYTGTINALRTVVKYEGFLALYKGFWINSFQLVPHVIYITSYEKTRQKVSLITNNLYIMAFVGGGAGSIFAQIFSVPIDVISQHMMLIGQKGATCPSPSSSSSSSTDIKQKHLANVNVANASTQVGVSASKIRDLDRMHVPESIRSGSNLRIAQYISQEIYKNEHLRGFYRGYVLTTFLVSLNSSLWWPFYYFYQGQLRAHLPNELPTLAVQCLCGPVSSFSASLITNPLDCMRTRMQVTIKKESSLRILKDLWEQDGYRMFYRGLTARLSYSCFYSFFIILGYETVKKASLKPEYQEIFYSID